MSSLRPDGGRNGRSGRSRSRNRSRDDRAPSPDARVTSSTKDKRKARFSDAVDDDELSMPGAFEPDPTTKYETRKSSAVTPGLSALSAGLPPLSKTRDDSEEDSDRGHRRRGSRRYEDEPPARGMTMPSFPSMSEREDESPLPSSGKKTKSYPLAGAPAYPVEDTGPFAMMPSADYGLLNHVDYKPAPGDSRGEDLGPSSPTSRRSGLPPNAPYTPGHVSKESYTAAAPTENRRQSTQSYISEVREYRPKGGNARESDGRDRSNSDAFSLGQPQHEVREVRPRQTKQDDGRGRSNSTMLSVGGPQHSLRSPSPGRLDTSMNSLSVSGHRPSFSASGSGLPPPSPLLEAYKGTYQSISPMPSPMMLPADLDDDIIPISPLEHSRVGSKDEGKPQKRRARIYDPESDAKAIYDALNHRRHAVPEPLIEILPARDHDQIEALRQTYRKTYKYSGAKIDMTKHIKVMTEGNFGKICFVTASGRWKSEAYWANCWYQSHSASRELLIESLMGRSNADIREIKTAFRDKKYDDDLERCMRKELEPDKFRDAILLVLQAERQEETDSWGTEFLQKDVSVLRMALVSPEGGESAILKIVCTRSDKHLREVLGAYESTFKTSFAKDALKKSKNLVGEVIAHILNGVINRPARDSLLLHHAIDDIGARNKAVELRYELLMSRLVRLHWEPKHLALVKDEYRRRYKISLEDAIDEATKGDFGEFCIRLCEI